MGNKVCHMTQSLCRAVSHDFLQCDCDSIISQNCRHLRLDVWWLSRRTWWACDYHTLLLQHHVTIMWQVELSELEIKHARSQVSILKSALAALRELWPLVTPLTSQIWVLYMYSFVSNLCRINYIINKNTASAEAEEYIWHCTHDVTWFMHVTGYMLYVEVYHALQPLGWC